ncbi:MAG: DUF3574 domain-containing protein [Bacteroidota bacterium]
MTQRFLLMALFALWSIGGCTITHESSKVPAESGRFNEPYYFVSDRLFFGRNIPGGGMVSDSAWAAFLAEDITSHFPDGLTVWNAQGQWTDYATRKLERENVTVVEILHPVNAADDSIFAVIAETYRARFRQDAVLRSTGPVRMQVYDANTK